MKSTYLRIVLFVISFAMLLSFASCGKTPDNETTAGSTEATTAPAETTLEESTTAQPTEAETTLKIETSEATEAATTEAQTTEKVTETESETLTDTVTETVTETETETETDAETEETFPETNLILGEDVEYASEFTVSNVFDSDMVIQRDEFVRVWGWAPESENGKKVSATFMGYRADALIENGEWEIVFYQRHEANASLGNDLVVYAGALDSMVEPIADNEIETDTETETNEETGTETNLGTDTETEAEGDTDKAVVYVFEDVLIGDVFMVVGQSNVQYSVGQYLSSEPDLKWNPELIGENSIIRYNYNSNTQSVGYPRKGTDEVCKDAINDYGWVIPNESNVIHLSAIGYLMAHQIAELTDNNIPVGISQFSASGRPLSVFMPNELAEQIGSDRFDTEKGIYVDNHYAHVEARYMYNHYMYAFERMPIAGIVWYQGEAESNIELSSVYVERFTALMEYMRSTHNIYNKEFPVFFVEFPTVYKVQLPNGTYSPEYLDTGRIRACTGMIPLSLPNSYIAVGADLWDDETNTNNIHPYCKYEQAERVTDLMQAVIYGTKTMDEVAGPTLISYEISEDRKTVTLKFANCGDGLKIADGGDTVMGIEPISKKNQLDTRSKLTVEITAPDTITITSTRAIYGVAYNCVAENFFGTDVNLCDSDGKPAHAFWIYEYEK